MRDQDNCAEKVIFESRPQNGRGELWKLRTSKRRERPKGVGLGCWEASGRLECLWGRPGGAPGEVLQETQPSGTTCMWDPEPEALE